MAEPGGSRDRAKVSRAQRFPIQMAMRYRVRNRNDWLEARIENVSRSGVLFRGQQVLEVNTEVEITFVLPVTIPAHGAGKVVCDGYIVRAVPPSGTETSVTLAAKIVNYQLFPTQGSRLP